MGTIAHPSDDGADPFEICGESCSFHEGKTKQNNNKSKQTSKQTKSLKRETHHISNKVDLHSRCGHKADRPRESCNKALNGG